MQRHLNTIGGALWSFLKISVGVFLGSRGSSVVVISVVVSGRNLLSLSRDFVTWGARLEVFTTLWDR